MAPYQDFCAVQCNSYSGANANNGSDEKPQYCLNMRNRNSCDVKCNNSSGTQASASKNDTKPRCRSTIADVIPPSRRQFIKKVYCILSVQLLVTTVAGFLCFHLVRTSKRVQTTKPWPVTYLWVLFAAIAASAFAMLVCGKAFPQNYVFLSAYTFSMSAFLGLVFGTVRGPEALLLSFGITAAFFFIPHVCYFLSRARFAGKEPYIVVAIFVLALFVLGTTAFGSFKSTDGCTFRCLSCAAYFVGMMLVNALMVYQTQKLVSTKSGQSIHDNNVDDYVFDAFGLYAQITSVYMATINGPLEGLSGHC